MRMHVLVLCAITAADVAACTSAPGALLGSDASLTDAPLDPCSAGDPTPWVCVQPGAGGTLNCSDSRFAPACTDGQWVCPFDFAPDRHDECRCWSGPLPAGSTCVCTDAGLECSDAGA